MNAVHFSCLGVVLAVLFAAADKNSVPDGDFRTTVKRLVAVRDLEAKTHTWTIHLQVASEPGVRPLFIYTQPDELVVKVDNETVLKPISPGTGRIGIPNPDRMEIPIRVEAPTQPAAKIELLKGSYTVLGSKRTLDFVFESDKPGPQSQSKDGVTASLHEFKATKTLWTVRVQLTYPDDTPDFESFESWLGNNEILLHHKDGKRQFPPNGGYSVDDSTGKTAIVTYRFVEDKSLTLGKPEDWKIMYRTPAKIEKLPLRFEFKDLLAP